MRCTIVLAATLLIAACNFDAGDNPPLHHPGLSISELARSGESNSAVFKSYTPSGPVRWNQGWPWKFDLTGIAWDHDRTITAITPRHVVMANHFQRKAGSSAVFHDRDGRPHRRVILKVIPTSQLGYRSDVAIGLLDQPLPKSIRTYPLLDVSVAQSQQLVGALALITEQERKLYFHRIAGIGGSTIRFSYDPALPSSRKKKLVTGDSGNPSFLLTKGELALIETHTGGGPGGGPFYGSPEMIQTIRKIVAQLDSSYPLRTVGIDQKLQKDAQAGRAAMPNLPLPGPPTLVPSPNSPSNSSTSDTSTRSPRSRVVAPAPQ